MKDVNSVFAENLSALRKTAGLTQLELAEKINYSDKAVSKWERGEAVPDVSVLIALADVFGVTLDYLVKEHSDEERLEVYTEKRANIGLIVTLMTFMSFLFVQIVVFLSLSGVGNAMDVFLFCMIYPLPLWACAATVFMAIWCNPKYLLIPVFTLVLLLTTVAFLFVRFVTGEFYYLIFVVLVPAELIVFLSFKLGRDYKRPAVKEKL